MLEPIVPNQGAEALERAAALRDPVRRSLFSLVVESIDAVSRDEAASEVGIGRSLAGYHLDQLVEDGLLIVTYARRSGRTGPGAGRPAKLYEPAAVEVAVQLPPRDDALVAHLLAAAIESEPSGSARKALRNATRSAGRALGSQLAGPSVEHMVQEL